MRLADKTRIIMDAIEGERVYQIDRWGDNPHELPGWLLIMQSELDEAKQAWCKSAGNDEALKEILQVVAVGIACLEQYGIVTRFGSGIRWEASADEERVFEECMSCEGIFDATGYDIEDACPLCRQRWTKEHQP